ncbi:MAG: hypothetical protein J6Y09_05930, partial [Lachnospiraceae bacterium]|nr:hypothetical protein [Lachnospiraceae bacterium]
DYVIQNYEYALQGTINRDSAYTSPSASELITDLNIARDDYQTKMVTCSEADFDSTYNEYMQELKDIGIDTIISEREAYFGK